MKKFYYLFCTLFFTGSTAFSQSYLLKSEISPVQSTTDSRTFLQATVMDNDTWCHVEWFGPPFYDEIWYDDDEADDYFTYSSPGNMSANRFTPTGYPVNVYGGRISVGDGSFPGPFLGSSFRVLVFDDDGENGYPGTVLDSMEVMVNNYGWVEFYGLTAVITEGNFYLAMKQLAPSPDAAPVGVDLDNPTYFKSYIHMVGAPAWVLSPLQDFMIRAWVRGTQEPPGDIDYYQVDRFSNFDPCADTIIGITTFLDTTSVSDYHDYDWAGLPQGWYAFGVKEHYTSGEWSDYEFSNKVGHLTTKYVTFNITLCDTTWSEYTVFTMNGDTYPIDMDGGGGTLTFAFSEPCGIYCDVTVCCPGNDCYFLHNQYINSDKVYNIVLSCSAYPIRNLIVDPVSLQVNWDPPQVVGLEENFESPGFPPVGWDTLSQGNGWISTADGSGGGWNIPDWYSHYVCANDLLTGNGNNGSLDYLITPGLNLKYRFDNYLTFYSYFDGSNGQEAFIEYSFDGSDWETLYQPEPSTSWEKIELDLSNFSGPESDPVWFAFHADDNGQDASGWAVDSVRVYSPEPPSTIEGYWVFLNDSLVGTTTSTLFNLPPLIYGEEYSLKVKVEYPSGLSTAKSISFISKYLYPPSCFYLADSGNFPYVMCPPLDSTGTIPPGFLAYNLYRDGECLATIPYNLPPPPAFWDDGLQPGIYQYELTAVYDLTSYGYPGESGESMGLFFERIVRYGYPLPFLEQWNLGTFETNNWQADGPNWSVNGNQGNPDPSAEFTWDPIQVNYEISLESPALQADLITVGKMYLDFDVRLNAAFPTGSELMVVQVWNWESQVWSTVNTYSNLDGSFDWLSEHLDITDSAMSNIFKIRFSARGDNSINIVSWFIDNIHIYRACSPPENLNAHLDDFGMSLSWDYPSGTGFEDQWIHWDDGEISGNSIQAGEELTCAARWTPDQLNAYECAYITEVAFVPAEDMVNYTIKIWEGENAANLIIQQVVNSPILDQWNHVILETPILIDITKELWVGYTYYGWGWAGVDDGPAIDGFGNMVSLGGDWMTLLDANPELDFNWSIQAFIIPGVNPDTVAKYAIYRSDEGNPYFLRDYSDERYYLDDSTCFEAPGNFFQYKVTALYIDGADTCESDYSDASGDVCEGINDETGENNINIYPNPANDLLKIESSKELGLIYIYNSFGELILKKKVDERQFEISVADYPPGVYMIGVETGKEMVSKKIVVMH